MLYQHFSIPRVTSILFFIYSNVKLTNPDLNFNLIYCINQNASKFTWTDFCFICLSITVDHNIFAAQKFRESGPRCIFATQNFRECAGTSTKRKSRLCRKKAAVNNNNVICYRSAFVRANGPSVPVEIVSIRGLRPWTRGGESNLWKHWGGKFLCCGYGAASKSTVCSISGVAAQTCVAFENIAGYVKRLAVPAGGPVWFIAAKWCPVTWKLFLMLKQTSYFTRCKGPPRQGCGAN